MKGSGRAATVFAALVAAAWCVAPRAAVAEDSPDKAPADTKKEPSRVDRALDWLARHQQEDGRWSAPALGDRCEGAEGDTGCGAGAGAST